MRKIIAGGLMAAGVAGLGFGGYALGESRNDNPEGSHIDDEHAMEAAYAGYVALAGEDDCEATVLTTLSTLENEWYEPPNSKSKTYDALAESCPDGTPENQERLAGEASKYFKSVTHPAITDYEKALDSENYGLDEKFIFTVASPMTAYVIGLMGYAVYAGVASRKSRNH